jgi:hypothetical protein
VLVFDYNLLRYLHPHFLSLLGAVGDSELLLGGECGAFFFGARLVWGVYAILFE